MNTGGEMTFWLGVLLGAYLGGMIVIGFLVITTVVRYDGTEEGCMEWIELCVLVAIAILFFPLTILLSFRAKTFYLGDLK